MLTTILLGLLVVSLSMAVAVAGLLVVQRLVPLELRESHNVAIGVIYASLYIVFGMVVGFSAFLALDKYTTAQHTVKTEASNVEELYWLAEQFPEPEKAEVQTLAVSYARTVVDKE